MLRSVDLFAGTGAFTYALESTGRVKCVFANDMVAQSKTLYDANFDHPLTLADLTTVDVHTIPAHDILTGGFPCQPFSVAGRREGFGDPRSNVFWKIVEILRTHRPSCVILENVKNLVNHDEGRTFATIREQLESIGYHLHTKVLSTAEITGVPQHRERIYIVGFLSKEQFDAFSLDFPSIPKRPIRDLLQESVPTKYYYKDTMAVWPIVRDSVTKEDTVYQYRRVYVRENKSNECPTLTANMGGGGHNVPLIRDSNGIRKLTPRECFTFQGFPESYVLPTVSDTALYKLAGNAVSVPVVQRIADRLVPLLTPS